jgi:predicted nucleic acid-binding protein
LCFNGSSPGLTAYDAAYLDLALENGLALATLDETLFRAWKNAGATSLWV